MVSNARKLYDFEIRVSKLNNQLTKSSFDLKQAESKSDALSVKLANVREDKKSNIIIGSLQQELNEVSFSFTLLPLAAAPQLECPILVQVYIF